ncbi:phage portal protein [Anaerotruncus rubiinfantis]|uniref:phage portal protein n=1 Tax=Anaerotruncus rubiinfantis TaxID=1720200 RepID=UPI001897D972|nr:phage portal protein [Anaerotruncus rubiinfantis]
MSIFQRIFSKAKPPAGGTSRAEIIGGGNSFSAWSGNAYSNDIYRGAVDAIARNAAKLKGSHVIKYRDNAHSEGDCKLNRILQIEPNPYMSAFDVLYKIVTHYFLYNNAFAYRRIAPHEAGVEGSGLLLDQRGGGAIRERYKILSCAGDGKIS